VEVPSEATAEVSGLGSGLGVRVRVRVRVTERGDGGGEQVENEERGDRADVEPW